MIGYVEILPLLYGKVVIPPEVLDELRWADVPSPIGFWANHLRGWLESCTPEPNLCNHPKLRSLGYGEKAAIAVAIARQPSILLIDERAGSAIAREFGLPVTGTLGVLDEAARRKLISLPEAVDRLKQTSFRYPKSIVERLLQ